MKLLLSMFLILGLVSCSKKNSTPDNNSNYKEAIESGEAIGIDVRTVNEYIYNGSPKAKNIPVDQLQEKASGLDKNKTIIVFCESGGRATQAKNILEQQGFKNVINLGDWRAWNKLTQ